MEKLNVIDFFFEQFAGFYKLSEEEGDLLCEEATDEELDILLNFKVTIETSEIIKKYITHYNYEERI